MSERIHVLAQQIFGKSSVAECDLQEIKDLVQRYPYFAPGQFLLLEKLKQEAAPEYPSQAQKAVLYYSNPLEFDYFISSEKFYSDVRFDQPLDEEVQKEEPPATEQAYPAREEPAGFSGTEELTIAKTGEDAALLPDDSDHGTLVPDPATELPNLQVSLQEEEIQAEPEQTPALVTLALAGTEELKLQPTGGFHGKEAIAFEPFHTVDYFASQGIKLTQDESPKDKFGKQLKSFTEWLKTMKKIPAQTAVQGMDVSTEKRVQHLAEDSVHEADVVTEAMAEVWMKQGNRQKALEVYNKLSLLNPSKKAYFAAKIDHLNRSE